MKATASHDLHARALRLLTDWSQAAESEWAALPDAPGLGCYGPGYQHWGVQSNLNYAAAVATLAAHGSVADRERHRQRALAAFRFALATHLTGTRPGADGKHWGNAWISMLGLERAMHGLAHVEEAFAPADRAALQRLLVSEADWSLTPRRGQHAGVCAGLWNRDGRNNPESNIWTGCLLWRVAARYPAEPHAEAWREQAHRFLINGVSVPADATDATPVAGQPVSARHAGANFFPQYALDHHGYLNVGYMVICASNAAMLHFDCKRDGLTPPESLYHHQADLWRVLRRFLFADGRLARIGGDSRVRYAYCQEYLLPALLLAADCFGDAHALELAANQLALMETEAAGGAGWFYARRLDALRRDNPHYYTRLESDRACVLAMLLNHLPQVNPPPRPDVPFDASVGGAWSEAAHGAVMHRAPARLASFAWRAHGLTQGLCVPPGDSSLAEWARNLSPVVQCLGDDDSGTEHRRLLACGTQEFTGGFVTYGAVMEGVNVAVDEGTTCTDQAVTSLAFAALPDGRTCLCLQHVVAAADRVVYLRELKDLHAVIPNDVFNGNCRTLHSAAGATVLQSPPGADAVLDVPSRWINFDDRLGFVALHGAERMQIVRSGRRRAGRYHALFTEEVCLHVRQGVARCRPGEVLVDVGFAVLSGATAADTAAAEGGALAFPQAAVRGVWVRGADGTRYALVANFSSSTLAVHVWGEPIELAAGVASVHTEAARGVI